MKENLFGLLQKEHLSSVSVSLKNAESCAITIQNSRIIKRKAIEHEIKFYKDGQLFAVDFKANRKYFTVFSTYPLKGIRSCFEHDGSMVKKLKMGYFNDQELQLSDKGRMHLLFLLKDIINTTQLAQKNPGIIAGYYSYIRQNLENKFPHLISIKIKFRTLRNCHYTTWLSDTVRKKHFFSYNGINMFLSFQAIIENHPELFNAIMN